MIHIYSLHGNINYSFDSRNPNLYILNILYSTAFDRIAYIQFYDDIKQAGYYKKITEALKHSNEIVLFGPTKAKNELMNLLTADHHFANKKIEVKQTDKMTENQQKAFVKEHFHAHK